DFLFNTEQTLTLFLRLGPLEGYPPEESVPHTIGQHQMQQTMDVLWPHIHLQPPTAKPPSDLVSQECLKKSYTHLSCAKVFCPPWRRCISGQCVCKLPYQCLRRGRPVCGMDGRSYFSLCQAQAIACRSKTVMFSHYGSTCGGTFKVHLEKSGHHEVVLVEVDGLQGKTLVCGDDWWDTAAANVVCRHKKKIARGAVAALRVKQHERHTEGAWPQCVRVRCTGSELSLAECTLSKPQSLLLNSDVAAVHLYTGFILVVCREFRCGNGKCVSWEQACNGIDDCGDRSDEMCCKGCHRGAFFCKTGVCIHPHALGDKIRDCLGGEDELHTLTQNSETMCVCVCVCVCVLDILDVRNVTESQLHCGIPNMEYIYKTEEETRHTRVKRVVGGEEALPTQIQWQVAVVEDGQIHCGGAYLGGCWVLTAAHCVRPKPKAFQIKFSIWKKLSLLNTTDIVPVKNIIIHQDYNPSTYQNDIALVQLKELNLMPGCLKPNPAVRAVCVPWSTLQFQPGSTCSISGWGRNKVGDTANILKWANVTLIEDCGKYYSDRFYEGMECAGDLEGKVDSCQGDSGGPLVCTDASGMSYVWGIVSWGEKCGEVGFPGVYTKVAHYFEWIRFHMGWQAVTKFNQ
uniref:trypsin n=1 Tax=Electrophorus electricus TaxID=8005 RepID=A0A4W4EAG5_ELEEL